mgnify:CR=1 FL=1
MGKIDKNAICLTSSQNLWDGILPSIIWQKMQFSTNKVYHYRVRSKDAVGNLAISGDNSFKTTTGSGSSVGGGGSPFVKKTWRSPEFGNTFYTIIFVVFMLIAIIFYAISKKIKKNKRKR